jgi:type II secretory pathway component HofQ
MKYLIQNFSKKQLLIAVFILAMVLMSVANTFRSMNNAVGYTEEEVQMKMKIQKLELKNVELMKDIEQRNKQIESYETSIEKDSSIIYNSSRNYRDSLRAKFNPSRQLHLLH